jgi:hypothetical protein
MGLVQIILFSKMSKFWKKYGLDIVKSLGGGGGKQKETHVGTINYNWNYVEIVFSYICTWSHYRKILTRS